VSAKGLRLLFLLPFAPQLEGRHGGATVSGQLVSGLAARHDVQVLHLAEPGEAPADPRLRERCRWIEAVRRAPGPTGLPARLALRLSPLRGVPIWAAEVAEPEFSRRAAALAEAWQPDVIQVEYPVMGRYLGAVADSGAARVLVHHDARFRGLRTWPGVLGGLTRRLDERAWVRFERRVVDRVDGVVVFTEPDREAVKRLGSETPIEVIPFGIRVPATAADPVGANPPRVLFVGSFAHPPNADAALWLAGDLFPAVRAQHPDARLVIVGPDPPPELVAAGGPGIEVTGAVPDVAPYVDTAAVVVAPMRSGGGMRVKVLEALAAGKAVVATPLAAEGLAVTSGEQLEIAADARGFNRELARLLGDREARRELGTRARTWAEHNLGWDQAISTYEALYARLIHRARGRR
jgi:glycosyltransferase involved in cell wall biosynthesis